MAINQSPPPDVTLKTSPQPQAFIQTEPQEQCESHTLTTVIHAVEPGDIHSTEVKPLADDVIEIWYGGGNRGGAFVLVERQRPVVHDGLIVIRRVQVSDEVILILIEIMLHPCNGSEASSGSCSAANLTFICPTIEKLPVELESRD